MNGPDDTKINVEEFDLNVDYRLWFREKCALERRDYEEKIISDMNNFKIETEDILKKHWTSLFVKPKSLHVRILRPRNETILSLTASELYFSV